MAKRILQPIIKPVAKAEEKPQSEKETNELKIKSLQEIKESKQDVLSSSAFLSEEEQSEFDKKTWGVGFTKEEYASMNVKLNEFRKYYPIRTAMHQEALVTYIKLAQKRDTAILADDVEKAEKWGKLAAAQAKDAKINPNQLSAADLSNGISSIGKVVEAVEKVDDIIPILPTFLRQPKDEPDYLLYIYILYCERLGNKPESTYEEVYKYVLDKYEQHKEEYKYLLPGYESLLRKKQERI